VKFGNAQLPVAILLGFGFVPGKIGDRDCGTYRASVRIVVPMAVFIWAANPTFRRT